ncbi:transporter substrate-binding domain-containing protein [Clostridium sp. PL3]|uniref:Transporter substrate-binding domain-containing protein n=1 Tax=Clostridium thailandense TaxID=2794346 RepID=A0A949U5B7_9CLOT|nr:transporter substrate-binding domain-containing protein [Clostridium thailandense]MBV7276734.1 transporter substrate-binding domain-containing protein [Clostridium thailandense]
MNCVLKVLIFLITFNLFIPYGTLARVKAGIHIELTKEEEDWLYKNRNRIFTLGINPDSGKEYFIYEGQEKGYLIPLVKILEEDLGLKIKIEASKSWDENYLGLQKDNIDILFGANETNERKKTMTFTRPITQNPYLVVSKKDNNITTIGDIDKKNVGFMKSDIVTNILENTYKNVKYNKKFYISNKDGINALNNNEIDAFITVGVAGVYDYVYRFPDQYYYFKLNSIVSDETLSTRKDDRILAEILDKEIAYLSKNKLSNLIDDSEVEYNVKIMNLTPNEIQWLKNDGKAVMGVTKDFLPFDYYENGQYKGISGEIINEISKKTGIKFTYNYEDFDTLYDKLKKGKIDILNIAKTDERLKYVLYLQPYDKERDIIIGRKDSEDIKDIFELEGKRVAVVKGYWHYEYLKKNLANVDIIDTKDIEESLMLVHKGKADYLIENPSVVRYYIEELMLYDLVEEGRTSADSYLYYGVTKGKPELASIINKVMPLIDKDKLEKIGYEEVPHVNNKQYYKKLISIIVVLIILLILIILYVIRLIKDLIKKKTELELIKQREQILYIDTLTEVYNRNYFSSKIKNTLDEKTYPQTIIVADLNNLKPTNDKYGHHIGDELLKGFTSILKEVCPEESLIFRFGGDEFHIILEKTNEKQAEELIGVIKEFLEQKSIIIDENTVLKISAAFGYATRYFKEQSFEELIKIADKKMYVNKNRYKE